MRLTLEEELQALTEEYQDRAITCEVLMSKIPVMPKGGLYGKRYDHNTKELIPVEDRQYKFELEDNGSYSFILYI